MAGRVNSGGGRGHMVRENMTRGGLVLAFGVVSVMEALRLKPFRGPKPVGDDTFPLILGSALIFMGLLLAVRNLPIDKGPVWPAREQLSTMGLTLLSLAIYCVIISFLGYMLSTFLLAAGLFRLIGRYRWHLCLIMAAVLALCLWQVFIIWLRMPFPTGMWSI